MDLEVKARSSGGKPQKSWMGVVIKVEEKKLTTEKPARSEARENQRFLCLCPGSKGRSKNKEKEEEKGTKSPGNSEGKKLKSLFSALVILSRILKT